MFRLDEERCIKCTLCARDCPIDIIYIDWHQEVDEETKKKEPRSSIASTSTSSAACSAACARRPARPNPKSIWLTTKTYELASYERWEKLYVDMDELQKWRVRPDVHRRGQIA